MKKYSFLLIFPILLVGCSGGGTSAPEDDAFFKSQKEAMQKNPPNPNDNSKKTGMRKEAPKPGEKPSAPAATTGH